ncbi:hypothetical protein [Hymenobacter negativus]|uniref:DUF1499 domain-containing protein n=1 Tax=Hymenobacter negativus TaxID=2795026 RepID=A0ABS0QB14_9BACT|nr:hypothetical protein [Hymenobacter negativus]MBH8559859.1 hypothetical protein [Hymenobacter negativus]
MKFIENAKGLAQNPLGIIALFVSLIYGIACLVLSISISKLEGASERLPLIWFIIGFPMIILIAFVFLVTFHHEKLYSPSDYGNPDSFLKTLKGAEKFDPIQIDVAKVEEVGVEDKNVLNRLIVKAEGVNLNKGPFSDETKENVRMANDFFKSFMKSIDAMSYRPLFEELTFGAQAPEYFYLRCSFKKEHLNRKNVSPEEQIIIRVTRDDTGSLNMIGIGKDIIEKSPIDFANKVVDYIDKFAKRVLKSDLINKD